MHTCLILPKIFPFLTKKVVKGTWVDILFITLCFQIVPKQLSTSLASISLPFTIHGTSWHHSRTIVLNNGAPFIVVGSTSLHLGSTGGWVEAHVAPPGETTSASVDLLELLSSHHLILFLKTEGMGKKFPIATWLGRHLAVVFWGSYLVYYAALLYFPKSSWLLRSWGMAWIICARISGWKFINGSSFPWDILVGMLQN